VALHVSLSEAGACSTAREEYFGGRQLDALWKWAEQRVTGRVHGKKAGLWYWYWPSFDHGLARFAEVCQRAPEDGMALIPRALLHRDGPAEMG
jgi:hypothetical protein